MRDVICTTVIILLTAANIQACSCFGVGSVSQSYRTSDLVVTGQVVSIEKHDLIQDVFNGDTLEIYRNKVTIKVIERFKNGDADFVTVFTGMGDADCGFNFRLGRTYVLYASKESDRGESRFVTNICTRTNELAEDSAEIEKLRKLSG